MSNLNGLNLKLIKLVFFAGGGGFYDPSMDPSNRRDVSLTVEFTVTNEVMDDDTEPWYINFSKSHFLSSKKLDRSSSVNILA